MIPAVDNFVSDAPQLIHVVKRPFADEALFPQYPGNVLRYSGTIAGTPYQRNMAIHKLKVWLRAVTRVMRISKVLVAR
jgi:hypothetical protein